MKLQPTKPHVLLMYGGESNEHEISILSARNVVQSLRDSGHRVSLVYISRQGQWLLVDSVCDSPTGTTLLPKFSTGSLLIAGTAKLLSPDAIFPILHGPNGEDGTVQSVARLLHIPCVGPSMLHAAVTMNKDLTKRLLRDAGIATAPWKMWSIGQLRPSFDDIVRQLGVPFFVKPVDAGSSVGVTKVHSISEYQPALDSAALHGGQVIIEQFIDGREFEVAVIGEGIVSGVGEIIPEEAFYSYRDKYDTASTAQVTVTPKINSKLKTAIRDTALRAYQATYGSGMARVDFLVKKDGAVYVESMQN